MSTASRSVILRELVGFIRESWLNVLLIFIPISLGLDIAHASPTLVFFAAAVGIVPLAGLIGQATEATAEHTGPGLGGFLNATFGNATELIIALLAVRQGLYEVVKASITGSVLSNMLLVLGASMFFGGLGRPSQVFNRTAAGASASMLMLAVTALVMPALWDLVAFGSLGRQSSVVDSLSLLTAIVLIVVYVASLVFSLVTNRELFGSVGHDLAERPRYSLAASLTLLILATVVTALQAEVLVGAIEPTAAGLGLTDLFIGVIIVAVIGNAAEHFTAVSFAAKGQMDLAFNIAIGSSTQIALLVAPLLVFASFLLGQPMDLVFHPFEIVALALAVGSVAVVSLDGESNWFEGLQLIAVYVMVGIAFYFVP